MFSCQKSQQRVIFGLLTGGRCLGTRGPAKDLFFFFFSVLENLGTLFGVQYLWIRTDMELGSTVGAVRSSRVLLGQEVRPAVVVIKDGKIHQIHAHSADVACEVG